MKLNIRTWSRRRKVAAGVAGAVVLLTAGVAIAALLRTAPFVGSGNVVQAPELTFQSAAVQSEDLVDCGASVSNPGVFGNNANLTFADAVQGGAECVMQFNVARTAGAAGLVVQDVTVIDGTVDAAFTDPGVCGAPIAAAPAATGLQVRFTVPLTAPTGAFTINTAAGIKAVSQGAFVPEDCPTVP
jgi:hypothetical protein